MPVLILCFVLAVAVSIGIGILAHRRAWTVAGGPIGWGAAAARRFGRGPGAVLVLVAGLAATAGIGLALGLLAKSLEGSVDKPVFRWVSGRVSAGSEITTANAKLTLLGDNSIIQLVAFVGGIVLVFAYRRRWWLPVAAIAVALLGEKYEQKSLGKIVDRGYPPASLGEQTLGTFPSGGVARILAVYGAIIVLVIIAQPSLSRAWRAGLWTGVVTGAVAEAFTRIYLSKHWLTDAVFALPFGALLLLTNVAAIAALAHDGSAAAAATPRSDGAAAVAV